MDYGQSDTSTTSLGTNQFPIGEVYVPSGTQTPASGGTLTALEGGPSSTDSASPAKRSAPASMYVKDGNDVAQGTTTDVAVTGDNPGTHSAKLRGLNKVLASVWDSPNHWLQVKVMNATSLGQATMQNSAPVAIASDQTTLPVSGTVNAGTGTFTNQQSNVQADYDTTAGAQNLTMFGMALPASGGAVAGGTSSNPLRTDPTGTTTQPVSGTITANAGTGNFNNASVGTTGAAVPASASYLGGNKSGNLTGISLDASGNLNVNVAAGGASGGTSSSFGSAFPATGTASGFSDGTNMQGARAFDADTGAGTQYVAGANLRISSSGGSIEAKGQQTMTNSIPVTLASDQGAVPVSGTFWQATQPVSGTITANAGTGPFPVAGMIASGASNANNPVKVGGAFNTTQPTVTNGQVVDAQYSARGAALVATGTDTFNVTVNAALPTGSNVIGHIIADSGSTTAVTQATASNLNAQVQGAAASGAAQSGNPVKVGGVFNTTQPTVTNGQAVDVQMTARGAQIVATGTDTFSVTANAGTNLNTSLLALESGGHLANIDTHTPALGSAVSASSSPVVLASDQAPLVSATATRSNVAAAAADTSLLASNTSRKGAIFFNDSTAILYLAYGVTAASTTSYSVQVAGNGYFELPPQPVFTGAIRGIWSAANGNVRITELS